MAPEPLSISAPLPFESLALPMLPFLLALSFFPFFCWFVLICSDLRALFVFWFFGCFIWCFLLENKHSSGVPTLSTFQAHNQARKCFLCAESAQIHLIIAFSEDALGRVSPFSSSRFFSFLLSASCALCALFFRFFPPLFFFFGPYPSHPPWVWLSSP